MSVALAEQQPHSRGLTCAKDEMIVRRGFRADMLWVHGFHPAMYDVVVDAILDIGRGVVVAVQAPVIRLVLSEEQLRRALAADLALAVVVMLEVNDCSVP